ncbi:efflux RND transporter periplasmic adaptor subunit [Uliginosibacterium sp. 31-16]|uniref:efflux RND transporter periplasmic adaptor subunit n=1 Tax=Uliginosibacterium sp. 31-16 TaxID=3068315 RepID=UPI00273F6D4F|nr:efflux RND transporter periplasmic adaptor subunit [Uliginosibacterium sp. 31-16]MDP5238491.1 efflux RND transporter periplasmic adaptor subunit [Uliginosibacterium sp. 31-16]
MPRYTLALLLSAVCLLLSACQNKNSPAGPEASAPASGESRPAAEAKGNAGRGNRPQIVTTTTSRIENVPLLLEAQGNVLALDEVDVRPQKSGMITQIHFKEGDEVRKGQLLFSLDARDDEANVGKAAAGVASAEAALSIAQRDLKRSQELSDKNFIAPSALDTTRSKADTAIANLTQARAALEQARVSQSYTRIHAPFDGRAGLINVRPGSLVTSTSTAGSLVKLTRMNPIGVTFSLPERDVPALLDAMRKGPVKLSASTSSQDKLPGEVIFVDSNVDRASGTLLVKAKLDNSKRSVWPGQYVSVKVEAGSIPDATVLPAQAVINGPNGRLVYVIDEESTAQAKPVELLRIASEKAVIKGLPAGVKVVLEGGQNLRPGSKVTEAKSGDKGESRGKRGGKPVSGEAAREAASSAAPQAGIPQNKAAGGSSGKAAAQ